MHCMRGYKINFIICHRKLYCLVCESRVLLIFVVIKIYVNGKFFTNFDNALYERIKRMFNLITDCTINPTNGAVLYLPLFA